MLIVEVLSESTKDYDRGEKFESYRTLSSLQEYLTVAQEKVHVEHYTRQPYGKWLLAEFNDASASIFLPSLEIEIPISSIYEKVDFGVS